MKLETREEPLYFVARVPKCSSPAQVLRFVRRPQAPAAKSRGVTASEFVGVINSRTPLSKRCVSSVVASRKRQLRPGAFEYVHSPKSTLLRVFQCLRQAARAKKFERIAGRFVEHRKSPFVASVALPTLVSSVRH